MFSLLQYQRQRLRMPCSVYWNEKILSFLTLNVKPKFLILCCIPVGESLWSSVIP